MAGFESIPWAKPDFWGKEQQYVAEALGSTWISRGPFVDRLEREMAAYCGARYALTTSSGTTALHLALLALGVGPGDEVILPGFAFMAAANVVVLLHARSVFAEVDPSTWCMTAAEVEKCLTPRTRAIIPIHTYGNVCAMAEMLALARDRGIAVLEDAAEAFASRYQGRLAGSMGTVGTFSFHAAKPITTGEGGLVVTDDEDLYDRMCQYRSHGMLGKKYWHDAIGHNFRLTNLQAALGCAQVESLPRIIAERRRVHEQYVKHLSRAEGLTMQHFTPDVEPVLWAMAVKLDPRAYPQGRDQLMEQFRSLNVETRPGFAAASLMPIYAAPALPICEDLSRHVISLPTFASLRNEQIAFICDTLKSLRS